ncbi:MAG: dTDP-4-dehydrorhamnose 3,5-epimerase family protein [Chloroflexi bacterium]|nr:dTDP-4-dehydrorhamnose 3,5-epimerase family protein [Chloroflexota bacterium]
MLVSGRKWEAKRTRRIEGVHVKQLRWITDERGKLAEVFRCDDPFFQKFGQVYITTCYPGIVKGWHYHKVQTDNIAVVKGMAKLVLYDPREDSPTKGEVNEFSMGEDNPLLVSIPPLVLHGSKGYGTEPAFMLNCPTEPYRHDDPDEYRVDPFDPQVPYDWFKVHG